MAKLACMDTYKANEVQPLPETFDMVRLSKSKERVDLSPNTVRGYSRNGLRLYRHGKSVFFSQAELCGYIRAKCETETAVAK